MSTTFGEEIQKANASEPNVFTETASLPCVFWHNLLLLVCWRSSDRAERGYMEAVENNMKRRGFLGCDLCACMERWAGPQKSLFQLDRRRWLTHTHRHLLPAPLPPSIHPGFHSVGRSTKIFVQTTNNRITQRPGTTWQYDG